MFPRGVEENRHVHPLDPAVDLAGLEHALRADGAPDQGRVVGDFGAVAGEALRVGRRA